MQANCRLYGDLVLPVGDFASSSGVAADAFAMASIAVEDATLTALAATIDPRILP